MAISIIKLAADSDIARLKAAWQFKQEGSKHEETQNTVSDLKGRICKEHFNGAKRTITESCWEQILQASARL